MNCQKCGISIEKPPTGRPPRYCGKACRSAAGYEIRRITRRLEKLEEQRDRNAQETDAPIQYSDFEGRGPAERLAAVEKLILGAETRLRQLLQDSDDD